MLQVLQRSYLEAFNWELYSTKHIDVRLVDFKPIFRNQVFRKRQQQYWHQHFARFIGRSCTAQAMNISLYKCASRLMQMRLYKLRQTVWQRFSGYYNFAYCTAYVALSNTAASLNHLVVPRGLALSLEVSSNFEEDCSKPAR